MPDNISGRRTAFPNMWIRSIHVQEPPFDEEGVVQEVVGRGVTSEFEPVQKAGEITQDAIGERIDDVQNSFGMTSDMFKITYRFHVRVPVGNPFTERGVSMRARTWARLKNPFETDVIEVTTPTKNKGLSKQGPGDVYDVSVTVRK